MKRYVRLYINILRLSVSRALAYPQDFWTWTIIDILWSVVGIGFFRVILLAIPQISGWTFETLSIPLGILYLLNAVIWGIFWGNISEIPRDINKGNLDLYLLKPANSQFLISTRYIGLNLIPSVASGLFLLWYGFRTNHIDSVTAIVIPVALFSASLISYSIWFMMTTLAFYFNRLLNIVHIFPQSIDVARYPVTIFHPSVQFIFTYIIPFALMGFLPAEVMLGRKSPLELLLPIILSFFLLFLSHKFWNYSLKRYQSASS